MMYSVVQLIEKNKFKVMAVPSSWIRKASLLWPKLSNSKIEALRITGQEYDGPTRKIPVIVFKKFKSLQMAEDAAEELSKREVSDVDYKRKRLKPAKTPKLVKAKDYNLMVQECVRTKRKILSETNGQPVASQAPTNSSRILEHQTIEPNHSIVVQPDATKTAAEFMDLGSDHSVYAGATVHVVQPIYDQHFDPDITLPSTEQHLGTHSLSPMDQAASTTKMLTESSPPQSIQIDSDQVYLNQDEIMYFTPAIDADPMASLQIAGAMSYEQMKADLKEFIEVTVEKVVAKCFETHFARFAALLEVQRKEDTFEPTAHDSVERHNRINTEEELHKWNIELNNKELCRKYREYFSKIIIPNAYNDKGDNACYTIVDCLFTRDFWTKMTWTGISRGNKAKQGFREFGNVTQLLCSIVQIGDPTYTAKKLEMFCRNRLFRYCKSRSTNRQLRRSACRNRRGTRTVNDEASSANEQADETSRNMIETDQSESVELSDDYSSDGNSGGDDEDSNDGGLENEIVSDDE